MEKSRRRRTDLDIPRTLARHAPAKYVTGTQLGTSNGLGWNGLLAERWRHAPGKLGKAHGPETEVVVILEGRLPVRRGGDPRSQNCFVIPGTIGLCPAGVQEETVQLHGEIRESLHLFLPSLAETALRETDIDPDKVRLRYERGFRDPLIEGIGRTIRAEMLDPTPAGNMLVETLASALGVHLLQRHSNLASASPSLPVPRGALDPGRLGRVRDFIETNLGEDLTIEALANEACLSPFHFARAFKAATGMAPHRYLTSRRLEKARSWISEGRLSLAEIAFRCGFSSQASFTRWFKRLVGATPGEYRTSYC
ncbi:MAG: AraC family transcriptional regulator [Acidobacteriota bacterium]|nr:AraC family transcriptional regulator [Acidobacteriota bacterium]